LRNISRENKMLFFATIIGLSMLTIFPFFIYKLVKLQIPESSDTIEEVVKQ
jgi:hypothetical protein